MVAQVLKGLQVVEAWNRSSALWGLTMCITGTIIGCVLKILSKSGIAPGFGPYLSAIAVAVAVAGMGLMAYAFLPAVRVRHLTPQSGEPSAPAATQRELPAVPLDMVTEQTTELLSNRR